MNNENENEIIYYFHDLRNKMAQAKSCMYVAMDDHAPLKNNEWLNLCTEAIDRSTKILNDGLETFASDRVNAALNNELVNVEFQEFLTTINEQPYTHVQNTLSIFVEYSLLDQPKFIDVNPQKLYRLRDNIIDNAVQADATELRISIEMKQDYLIITCSDNGRGMTQDQIDQILINKYNKGDLHGFGTQYLLDTTRAHRSAVTINSELGKCTTFRFLCPYTD